MTTAEIVDALAKERRVEQLAQRVTHASSERLKDLCQIVYEALIKTREDRLTDLWENEEINFYIIRIIRNQWQSGRSDFHKEMREFSRRANELQIR